MRTTNPKENLMSTKESSTKESNVTERVYAVSLSLLETGPSVIISDESIELFNVNGIYYKRDIIDIFELFERMKNKYFELTEKIPEQEPQTNDMICDDIEDCECDCCTIRFPLNPKAPHKTGGQKK